MWDISGRHTRAGSQGCVVLTPSRSGHLIWDHLLSALAQFAWRDTVQKGGRGESSGLAVSVACIEQFSIGNLTKDLFACMIK